MVRRFPAVAATLVSVLIAAAPAAAISPHLDSGDDPFFPNAGNGGYDVRHYGLAISYDPRRRAAARAPSSPRATQNLKSFNLDLPLPPYRA